MLIQIKVHHERVNKRKPTPTPLFNWVHLVHIKCIDYKQHQTSERFEKKMYLCLFF